jgi:hypothetical protein
MRGNRRSAFARLTSFPPNRRRRSSKPAEPKVIKQAGSAPDTQHKEGEKATD